MTAPRLLLAKPQGQSAVRVIFDMAMRQLSASDLTDVRNVSVWTAGGGLPAITSVVKVSSTEFDLILSESAPLGAGYTVTVDDTVQSATGEFINPAFRTGTFDVTVPDTTIVSIVWVSSAVFDVVFSGTLATIDDIIDVVSVTPTTGGVQVQVIGVEQSGTTLRVTLSKPGTSGAKYQVTLDRGSIINSATNVSLKSGEEVFSVWGQGSAPVIAATSLTEDVAQLTFSDVLGFNTTAELPEFVGAYTTDVGSIGTEIEFPSASVVRFPEASFVLGSTVNIGFRQNSRVLTAGQSWAGLATSFVGAGTESTGVGTTTLNKTLGDPFELAFTGGVDSVTRAGRRLSTALSFSFTPSVQSYPLMALTFLNTQLSVVFSKTTSNAVSARLYRGSRPVGEESDDLPTSFSLVLLDASADHGGFVSVLVNGQVVLGARSTDVLDSALFNTSAGNTALAITLGSPIANVAFSVTFSASMEVKSFITTGLRGRESYDLVSFTGSSAVVSASAFVPASPGFQSTGKAAFGVMAEYLDSVDTIQVIIGLNEQAQPTVFTGSVTLMSGNNSPVDQVLFDQSSVLVGDNEIVAVFSHPKLWLGALVGVAIDINNVTYSVVVPVSDGVTPALYGQFTQQPASWAHPRLPIISGSFGSSAIIGG